MGDFLNVVQGYTTRGSGRCPGLWEIFGQGLQGLWEIFGQGLQGLWEILNVGQVICSWDVELKGCIT